MRIKLLLGVLLTAIAINLGVITALTQKPLIVSVYRQSQLAWQAINFNRQWANLENNVKRDGQTVRLMGLAVEDLGHKFVADVKTPLFALTQVTKAGLGSQQTQGAEVWELVVKEIGQVDKLVRNDFDLPYLFTQKLLVYNHQNQKLAVSSREPRPALPSGISWGKVLGETSFNTNTLSELISEQVKKYLAELKLESGSALPVDNSSATTMVNNYYGPSGSVDSDNGFSSSVVGGVPIVTYLPAEHPVYAGSSISGFSQLSADSLHSGDIFATGVLEVDDNVSFDADLSVGGSLNVVGTTTVANLEVSGTTTFSGSTTISSLGLGFSTGSVLFNSGTGIAQNNSNLFWDDTNKYFNLGTNTVASTLAVQGSGSVSPFTIASSTGANLLTVLPSGNVGLGTTTPAEKFTVNGNINLTGNVINNTNDLRLVSAGNIRLYSTLGSSIVVRNSSDGLNLFSIDGSGNSYFGSTGIWTASGNVGVGTTTPLAKFAVVGTSGANPILDLASSTGTSVVRVDPAGNVGIGTASPGAKLHVVGGIINQGSIYLPNDYGLYNWNSSGGIRLNSGGSVSILDSSGPEYVRFSSGNVGIGTTSPIAKLDLYGNLNVATGSLPALFVNTATGRVGIGNSNPTRPLEVTAVGNNPAARFVYSSGSGQIEVLGGSGGIIYMGSEASPTLGAITYDTTSNAMLFGTNGNSQRVIINSNGNVGIGTTTPSEKLNVYGNLLVATSSTPVLFANTATGNVGIGTASPGSLLNLFGSSGEKIQLTSAGDGLWLTDNGTANIIPSLRFSRNNNATASLLLDFPSNISARWSIGDAVTQYEFTGGPIGLTGGQSIQFGGITGQTATAILGSVHTDNNNGQLTFSTRGSGTTAERMRIDNNGNVGIGTSTITSRLVVQGGGANNSTNVLNIVNSSGTRLMTINNGSEVAISTSTLANTSLTVGNLGSYFYNSLNVLDPAGASVFSVNGYGPNTGGYLSVGTTTPYANAARLNVQTNAYTSQILNLYDPAGGSVFTVNGYGNSTTTGNIVVSGSGNNYFASNVGIGTTTPASKLEIASGQIYAPNGTSELPSYAFSNYRNSGMYYGPNGTALVSGTGIVDIKANTSGATPNTIELYLTPVSLSGGDATIQINGGQSGGSQNYRIVNSGSGTGEGTLSLRTPDQINRFVLCGTITTGICPTGQGTVMFQNTASTTPVVFRQTGGTAGTHETHVYATASALNIAPQNSGGVNVYGGLVVDPTTTTGTIDFVGPKYNDNGIRAYTDDGSPFAGTGMIWMKPAEASGYTVLEADNDQGFRLRVNNHTQATSYGNLTVTSTGWNFQSPSNSSHLFITNASGNVGIGTITPTSTLFVQGTSTINPFVVASSTGTQLITVLPSGNVGVGTTGPVTKLNILGTSQVPSGTAYNGIAMVQGSNTATLEFGSYSGSPYGMWLQTGDTTRTSQTYPLLLNPIGGNVGIGTTSPTTKLQVYSADNLSATNISSFYANNGTQAIAIGYDTIRKIGNTAVFNISNDTSGALALQPTSGNVGVGTTTPSAKLHVSTTGEAIRVDNNADYELYFAGTGSDTNIYSESNLYLNSGTAKLLYLGNGANSQQVAINAGNVGIGTTTPIAKLALQGTAGANPILDIASSTSTSVLRIDPAGNVGVGTTSPNSKFAVWGDGRFAKDGNAIGGAQLVLEGSTNANNKMYIGYDTTSNYGFIQPVTEGTSYRNLIFNQIAGNVGIATTTPLAKLAVVGTAGANPILDIASSTSTSVLRIDPAGNVGIGTANPTDIFSIYAGSLSTSRNTILLGTGGWSAPGPVASSTVDGTKINLFTNSSSNSNQIGMDSGGNFWFRTGGSQTSGFAWYTASDNSSSPTSKMSLTNAGNLTVSGTGTFGTNAVINGGGVSYFNGGNVGIGTTSPQDKLVVVGRTDLISAPFNAIPLGLFYNGRSGGYYLSVTDSNDPDLRFLNSGGGPVVTFNNLGNVGIGTTTPSKPLHVYNASGNEQFAIGDSSGYSTFQHSSNLYINSGSGGTAGGDTIFRTGTGFTTIMTLKSGGNIGIGTTSPQKTLHIYNAGQSYVRIDTASASQAGLEFTKDNVSKWITYVPGSSSDLRIYDSAGIGDMVTFKTGGNVGIGTTTPGHPLVMASGAHVTTGGTWTNASDINLKENFKDLDASEILNKIVAMPIKQWNYKSEDPSIAHIGPFAQDFYEAFSLGGSNTSISTIDPAGVALVGIQALNEKINNLSYSAKATKDILQNSAGNLQNSGNDLSSTTAIKLQSHLYLSEDSVGQAKILLGAKQVRVKFAKAYEFQPIVTLTPASNVQGNYWVADTDNTGFTIMLETGERQDVVFNWHAFASEKAKIFVSDGTQVDIELVVAVPSVSESQTGSVAGESTSAPSGSESGENQNTLPENTETVVEEPVPPVDVAPASESLLEPLSELPAEPAPAPESNPAPEVAVEP